MKRVLLILLAVGACAHQPPASKPKPRFYTGKDYGSEAAFNPLTQILNEGFDVLALRGQDRHVFDRGLGADASNVWRSLTHADATYRTYGWSVLRNEFLPISNQRQPGGGSWLPNYQSHLFGSGMVSARMTEWFEYHHVRGAPLWSAATMMTAHFLNEAVENNGWRALNEDATTDLLFFDVGGIVLWKNQYLQRAFSGSLQLSNWTGQPSWNPVSRTIETRASTSCCAGPFPGPMTGAGSTCSGCRAQVDFHDGLGPSMRCRWGSASTRSRIRSRIPPA
jgi:hypothetical protein